MTSTHAGIAHQPHGQSTIGYLLLEEVRVKTWVVDVSSRVVLTQTFYNSSSEATGKAKYVFPLPASAAVCAFEFEMEDEVVIVGEVKEKEEAAFAYMRAVEQGKTAALVERVTDDIFTISVGSIPATTRVTARLTFVMDLLDEAIRDHVRLQFPMHIAKRYGTPPAAIRDTSAADSPTRIHIKVDVQTSGVIHDIRSPTHGIEVRYHKNRSGRTSQRRMSAVWKSNKFLTSDFVLTINAEGLDKPRCFAEEAEGNEGATVAMQLTLVPKFLARKVLSQEYIFVIDRSYSMYGRSIETAKRTLSMLLRLLPSMQTTFNIFSFGGVVQPLWTSSRSLDTASLLEATSYVESMDADFPGTRIPDALQAAFNSRGLDRPAVVFLLTDGQIYPDDSLDPFVVISNAIQKSPVHAPVRLFVLGIGEGVSSDVCSMLARYGNGAYLFALRAEDICGKCALLLNAGRSKNLERIDIDWGCDTFSPQTSLSSSGTSSLPAGIVTLGPPNPIQQAPHILTKSLSGLRLTVFAITSSRTVPTYVKLITKQEGGSYPEELVVDVTKVKPFRDIHEDSVVPIVHTLAARKLVTELDEGVGPLPTPAPSDALLTSEDDLRKAGIVRLGLTYQLVTKHTSFVAVQRGDEPPRDREQGNGWVRSRLRQTRQTTPVDTQRDNPEQGPTILDDFISGITSFVTSVFGSLGNPLASNNNSHSRSHHQSRFPGAYDGFESDENESSNLRGRVRRSSPSNPRRPSISSQRSTDTFSTLSSLDSNCSSCWTSRPPSPLPGFPDPTDRAPSPDFQRDMSAEGHWQTDVGLDGDSTKPDHVSQEVYDLIHEMGVDGSFSDSPLLIRLVGEAVLSKGDESRIDKKVWATVVTAAYLKTNLQGVPDLLELLTEKAKEFVEAFYGRSGTRTKSFDEMVRMAVRLLNVSP
ncbi:hypothetical protein JVU11DRAFT_9666 [Chiua virens]|nr:hypothetical protein JVU11DRAFT_9666 [Chiua virens]